MGKAETGASAGAVGGERARRDRQGGMFVAPAQGAVPTARAVGNYLFVIVVVIAFFWWSLSSIGYALNFSFLPAVAGRIGSGFALTVEISLAALAASLVLGIALAAGESSRILPLRYLCDLYVKIIRGTPLIMQVYLFFYIVGTAWGIENRFLAGVIILSVFEAAYIAEIFRGSLMSIDQSQRDAARAVGFTRAQTMRFVILPQLAARTLPALTGQFASIIKDSSLLSVIAVIELTQTMREISAANFKLFECYLLLGALYLVLTLPITLVSKYFERRLTYAH